MTTLSNTMKKMLLGVPLMAFALASFAVSAGHHEKGEKAKDAMGMAKDKGDAAMPGSDGAMEKAKAKLQPSEVKMDDAKVKAKLDAAEDEANMKKLHDDDSKLEMKPE